MKFFFIKSLSFLIFLCSSVILKSQCEFDVLVNISPEVPDNIYCPGDMITLNTGEFDSYQWFYNFSDSNTGGTSVSGGTDQSLTLNASEWAVVYFYVEGTYDGCTEPSATVVWDSWVFAGVAISHDSQTEYCEGDSTLIENAFQGPTIFQWYKDGVEISGANESFYWVKESGTYTLSAAWPMCPNYFISSGVGPTFAFIETISPIITSNDTMLTADYGNSFQWYLEGIEIPGATDSSYEPIDQGNYTVEIVDDNGCHVSSEPYFFIITGVLSVLEENSFMLWPNPAKDIFRIRNHFNVSYDITISDIKGNVVFEHKNVSDPSQEIISIGWASGLYICKIKAHDQDFYLKLMKL